LRPNQEKVRSTTCRLGSEAIRIGQARGYRLEEIDHLPPESPAPARATLQR
jgi:2-dehydropantoate 2-reductase